jgi:hypothetical protein
MSSALRSLWVRVDRFIEQVFPTVEDPFEKPHLNAHGRCGGLGGGEQRVKPTDAAGYCPPAAQLRTGRTFAPDGVPMTGKECGLVEPPRVALPRSAPPTSCSAPDSTWNTAGHWRLLSLHSVSRVDGLREKHCGTQGEAMMRLADSGRCMFALV